MNCNNCTCPGCAKASEIARVVGTCEDMEDLPDWVIEHWEKEEEQEAIDHPGRTALAFYKDGKKAMHMVLEESLTAPFLAEFGPRDARHPRLRVLIEEIMPSSGPTQGEPATA